MDYEIIHTKRCMIWKIHAGRIFYILASITTKNWIHMHSLFTIQRIIQYNSAFSLLWQDWITNENVSAKHFFRPFSDTHPVKTYERRTLLLCIAQVEKLLRSANELRFSSKFLFNIVKCLKPRCVWWSFVKVSILVKRRASISHQSNRSRWLVN